MTAESAQPKRAMSPDPFPFSGWGLGTRLAGGVPRRSVHVHTQRKRMRTAN